jgi:hypothetical protein
LKRPNAQLRRAEMLGVFPIIPTMNCHERKTENGN